MITHLRKYRMSSQIASISLYVIPPNIMINTYINNMKVCGA